MSNLRDLQMQFQNAIKGEGPADSLPIFEANGVLKETRLGIYRYAYWTRVTDALSADFPSTDKLLVDWSFSFEDLVHDFMILETNNFASLSELSKAFFMYVLSMNPRMTQLSVPKLKILIHTLRTDYAILMCEMSPWSLLFDEHVVHPATPEQIADEASPRFKVVWNKSLQIFDTILVFQKAKQITLLDLETSPDAGFQNSRTQFFALMESRHSILNLEMLIEELGLLQIDEVSAQEIVQFLVTNEIVFFVHP